MDSIFSLVPFNKFSLPLILDLSFARDYYTTRPTACLIKVYKYVEIFNLNFETHHILNIRPQQSI
ncbi:unnamed protein product [Meloidogyne enterolobii]|uniref:Uncharacterized protein n=1 Tax=Meloidogyne enterolobii TaxID=390850 RepID=A0ACB0Y6M9_MELEN